MKFKLLVVAFVLSLAVLVPVAKASAYFGGFGGDRFFDRSFFGDRFFGDRFFGRPFFDDRFDRSFFW